MTTLSRWPELHQLTPTEFHDIPGGGIWVKRDDLFEMAGAVGGKARTCASLMAQAVDEGYKAVTTASSRSSPQLEIVSKLARKFHLQAYCHIPSGSMATRSMVVALENEAVLRVESPGYNSVLIRRALDNSKRLGAFYIPFGMECQAAIDLTAEQVTHLPFSFRRLVVPVGSGMSLAGIVEGFRRNKRSVLKEPIIGVVVGANPHKRLEKWNVDLSNVRFVNAGVPYDKKIEASIGPIKLDPIYEAKAYSVCQPGDLFWIVGVRNEG